MGDDEARVNALSFEELRERVMGAKAPKPDGSVARAAERRTVFDEATADRAEFFSRLRTPDSITGKTPKPKDAA